MKLADKLVPKKGRRTMSTMPAVEYGFTPNGAEAKSGTGHGTGTGGARRVPQATQKKK